MKTILAIGRNDTITVNPQACKHVQTVTIKTGRRYTVAGEATDSEDTYEQCLTCRWVLRDDRTWGSLHNEQADQIPY